jgi:hypothetical protein
MKNNSNLNLIKPGLLSQAERTNFFLTADLKGIMVGLLLGDSYAQKRSKNIIFSSSKAFYTKTI